MRRPARADRPVGARLPPGLRSSGRCRRRRRSTFRPQKEAGKRRWPPATSARTDEATNRGRCGAEGRARHCTTTAPPAPPGGRGNSWPGRGDWRLVGNDKGVRQKARPRTAPAQTRSRAGARRTEQRRRQGEGEQEVKVNGEENIAGRQADELHQPKVQIVRRGEVRKFHPTRCPDIGVVQIPAVFHHPFDGRLQEQTIEGVAPGDVEVGFVRPECQHGGAKGEKRRCAVDQGRLKTRTHRGKSLHLKFLNGAGKVARSGAQPAIVTRCRKAGRLLLRRRGEGLFRQGVQLNGAEVVHPEMQRPEVGRHDQGRGIGPEPDAVPAWRDVTVLVSFVPCPSMASPSASPPPSIHSRAASPVAVRKLIARLTRCASGFPFTTHSVPLLPHHRQLSFLSPSRPENPPFQDHRIGCAAYAPPPRPRRRA